jgi:hypothetical protein
VGMLWRPARSLPFGVPFERLKCPYPAQPLHTTIITTRHRYCHTRLL